MLCVKFYQPLSEFKKNVAVLNQNVLEIKKLKKNKN